jgi:hypothetical protein
VKLAFALAVLLAAAFACGGGEDDDAAATPDARAEQAVNAARAVQGELFGQVPPINSPYDCGIHLKTATPVPGRCEWTAVEQPPFWIVTFRETWSCNQFSRQVAGYPDCTAITGFHEWEYQVDLATGALEQLDETGQFPPDLVQ